MQKITNWKSHESFEQNIVVTADVRAETYGGPLNTVVDNGGALESKSLKEPLL